MRIFKLKQNKKVIVTKLTMSGKRKPSFVDKDVDVDIGNDVDVDDDSFEASDLVGNLSSRSSQASASASMSTNFDSLTSTKNERTISSSSVSENDLDYESVSSPGNSSTASGPTYIRPAGFEHHAHDVLAPLMPPTSAKKLSAR